MKVYNENLTQEIVDYDTRYGNLVGIEEILGMSYDTYISECATFENDEIIPDADDMVFIPYVIYDETKTILLDKPDLSKGYLKNDKLFIAHHEEQPEVKEVLHIEIVKEYPNGGKDAIEVIDTPYQPYKAAYDEYEDIQVYIPYTTEELAKKEKEKYENAIVSKIRQKYSLNDELAILRQRDSKPDEFEEYNIYVEACKATVKEQLKNN